MPTKTWVVGEEALAADFNTFVQQQVVATFPNAAARDVALPAPKVGMVIWLDDTAELQVAFTNTPAGWRRIANPNIAAPPRFEIVGGGAGQSIPTGVPTTAVFSATAYNTVGSALSGGIFTCPASMAGTWLFGYAVGFQAHGVGVRSAWLAGPTAKRWASNNGADPNAVGLGLTGEAMVDLTAGQVMSVSMLHAGSGALLCNVNNSAYFQGRYLGPAT